MKFQKKPITVEATQWYVDGDHEAVRPHTTAHPGHCAQCGAPFNVYQGPAADTWTHGWIETLEGGHIVCPGDWIITGVQGEHYPCKPGIFDATYYRVCEHGHRWDYRVECLDCYVEMG